MNLLIMTLSALFIFGNTAEASTKIYSTRYSVPVSDDLKQFSEFSISIEQSIDTTSRQVSVKYKLPTELTGTDDMLMFKGKVSESGLLELSSAYGYMRCDISNMCAVAYDKNQLKFDHDKIKSSIELGSKNPQEISARLKVAQKFRDDPFGILILIP